MAKLSAQEAKFAVGFEYVAHYFGTVICDEMFHGCEDKSLTSKLRGVLYDVAQPLGHSHSARR